MYVERIVPETGEKFTDLESLARDEKTRLEGRYEKRLKLEEGYDARQPYEPTIDVSGLEPHLEQLEIYGTLIADQIKSSIADETVRHIAHRAIVHSALLAQDIVQHPGRWDLQHPNIDQVGHCFEFATYLLNAPTVYLAERPTLAGFANDLAKAISPRKYNADCYRAGRLAIGLGLLMSDDALYGQHIDRESDKMHEELERWDGSFPDNFGESPS